MSGTNERFMLSSSGAVRREKDLERLKGIVRARGRRRAALTAAPVVLIAIGAVWLGYALQASRPGPSLPEAGARLAAGGSPNTGAHEGAKQSRSGVPASHVEWVRNDPNIVRALSVRVDAGPRIHRVSDDELMTELSNAGLRVGIVRSGELTSIIPTDDKPAKPGAMADPELPALARS